jgi:regulator of chromosome condensation
MVVLATHGNIYTWGVGERGQLGRKVAKRHKRTATIPERIVIGTRANKAVVVSADSYASFAVDINGEVWGWGANNIGRTGTRVVSSRTADQEEHISKRILGLGPRNLANGERVVQIAGGDDHTHFLTSEGQVLACSLTIDGQLGLADGDPMFQGKPPPTFLLKATLVTFLYKTKDDPIVQVSAGTRTSLAIKKGASCICGVEGLRASLVPERLRCSEPLRPS